MTTRQIGKSRALAAAYGYGTHTGRWSGGRMQQQTIERIWGMINHPIMKMEAQFLGAHERYPKVEQYRLPNKAFTKLMQDAWDEDHIVPHTDIRYAKYDTDQGISIVLMLLRKSKRRSLDEAIATIHMMYDCSIMTVQAFEERK